MYNTSDFRKGLKIEIDGEPYIITDFQHVKPGKGNQFTRFKIKSLVTGRVLDRTYKSGEKVDKPDLEEHDAQFLYADGEHYNFMNTENYEQFVIERDVLGDVVNFLKENTNCSVLFHNGRPLNIDLPTFMELKVTFAEPGMKGDTSSGATKPVTLETGYQLHVPLFINEGDSIKVDTRDGAYSEKVNK